LTPTLLEFMDLLVGFSKLFTKRNVNGYDQFILDIEETDDPYTQRIMTERLRQTYVKIIC